MTTILSWAAYEKLLRPNQSQELPEKVHILVVDDDEGMLGPLVEMLEEAGYHAHGVRSAVEAIAYLMGRQESHIVLSDIYMTPQDGFKLLDLIRWVPLFTVRACMSSDPTKEEEAYEAGATHFINKNILKGNLDEVRPRLLRRIVPLAQTVRDHDRATNDPLTGLPHDVGFILRVRTTLSVAQHLEQPVSMVMADGDGIKAANDEWGHDAGTAAIGHIAGCLREGLREGDELARPYSGDEFLLLLPNTDEEGAIQVARRAARIVGGRVVTHDNNTFRVGISAGCVTMHPQEIGDDVSLAALRLVKMADEAMYARKRRRTKWRRAGTR